MISQFFHKAGNLFSKAAKMLGMARLEVFYQLLTNVFSRMVRQGKVSNLHLLYIFLSIFFVSLLVNLPASILHGRLQNNNIHARDIAGTVWDMRLGQVTAFGRVWYRADFKLAILPLVIGRLGGEFDLEGRNGNVSGKIKKLSTSHIFFSDVNVSLNTNLKTTEANMPVSFSLQGHNMVISSQGICLSGEGRIRTDFMGDFLGKIFPDVTNFQGRVSCQKNRATITLVPAKAVFDNDIDLFVSAYIQGRNLVAEIKLDLPDNFFPTGVSSSYLEIYGLKKDGDSWIRKIEARL